MTAATAAQAATQPTSKRDDDVQRAIPSDLLEVRKPLSPRASFGALVAAFILPLLVWCAFSYMPFLWHPMVEIRDPGTVSYFEPGMQVERALFKEENARAVAEGGKAATGSRENPVYLPPPHKVAKAMVTAFQAEPIRPGEPWLHQSILHSIRVILLGFLLSALVGIPIGLLGGTFTLYSRLTEPFIDFVRYMPAPAFGALSVAVLGINDAPKVAIIFIGTFFQMVLVLANTTRALPVQFLEAAQTLGAHRRQLVLNVVVPGILPALYRDMRILLGWAWTYLIVAELIGASSGISFFIYQQAKYRAYDNVYAAIILIGIIGFGTDLILKLLGKRFFPWDKESR